MKKTEILEKLVQALIENQRLEHELNQKNYDYNHLQERYNTCYRDYQNLLDQQEK